MGLARTTMFVGALAGGLLAASDGRAMVCLASKEPQAPIPYSSPDSHFNAVFQITHNPGSKNPVVEQQRYRVKSIEGDTVRWFREPMEGKGPVEDVSLYRAFARTGGGGWDFSFDAKAFDKLWPLKQGNEATFVVTVSKGGKEAFRIESSFCVRGNKMLKVGAGEYRAYLVDISQKVVAHSIDMKWDETTTNAWYVPQFGTALLMEDRILKKGKIILIRRREAVRLTADETSSARPPVPAKAPEPSLPPAQFQFPMPGKK